MGGRFEAENRYKIVILPMAIFFLFFIAPSGAKGQSLPESVIRILESEAESGGGDLEELVAYCEKLIDSPIDINSASESELSAFPLLSPFQVASILEYRQQYGDILSKGELALVDGFNGVKVERLLPFITFGGGDALKSSTKERISHKLALRGGEKYDKDSPFSYYGKYRFSMGDKLQVGTTVSSNGVSAHLNVNGAKIGDNLLLRSAVVGDFTARVGQGLLLWNSFSLSGAGAPSSILKMGGGLVPYTGSYPEDVFRGFGASLSYSDRVSGTFFYSEQQCRAIGGSVGVSGDRWRFGLNIAAYNDIVWSGGVSLDAVWSIGRFRFFSEVASDNNGDFALLGGVVAPISGSFDCSVLVRWYSPEYNARYAGAYSSISSCKNQAGALINLLWNPIGKVVFREVVDVVYYPAPRWGVKGPSFEVESSGEMEWSSGDSKVSLRCRYRFYGYEGRHQSGVRAHYAYKPSYGFYGAIRGEVVWNNLKGEGKVPGVALYIEGGYLPKGEKWEVAVRGTIYHVDEWDNRIYFYERELPQSFSVPALYRRGWDIYGYIKYAPLSRVGLYLKASTKMVKGQINLTF